jgi:hypothetical protein
MRRQESRHALFVTAVQSFDVYSHQTEQTIRCVIPAQAGIHRALFVRAVQSFDTHSHQNRINHPVRHSCAGRNPAAHYSVKAVQSFDTHSHQNRTNHPVRHSCTGRNPRYRGASASLNIYKYIETPIKSL